MVLDGDIARKRVVIAANCFIAVMAFLTSYINFNTGGFLILSCVQALVFCLCCFVIFKIQKVGLTLANTITTSLCYMLLVIYATSISNLHSGIAVWGMTLPVLFYLVNSVKAGFIFSFTYLGIYMWILVSVYDIEFEKNTKPYTNFLLSYLIVWGIAHVYEKNRITSNVKLTNLALKDSLTNTNNRLALKYEFQKRIAREQSLGLALLDIDHFKNINDTYGHGIGDEVLIKLSTLFKQRLAVESVFRLGGEEFVFLFNSDEDVAINTLERIRQQVASEVFHCSGNTELSITVSAGFIYFTQHMLQEPESLSTMLKIADKHLYSAKEQGRNRVNAPNLC
ncbi:GGDEF domain-containing protein [Alteromonas gracilis]|uniref:GGDEF domain-containing protein n=1 Tax=Alteromonas gracilis TaxID=1479524 RepID=UPI003735D241